MRPMLVLLLCLSASAQDLRSYLQRIADEQLAKRRSEVEAINTKEDYELRKARLRAAALRMIGGLDDPSTPLNARTTGKFSRTGYTVEKVIYESRPKFYVTANLYIPTGRQGPFPAILHPVGHSVTAKNRAFYQELSIGLVKQGFIVLVYDPIGQGERRIFWDEDLGDSKAGGTTQEHSIIGWQSLIGGESAAKFRIWDGIRSLDYLESRPEVDRARLGVTGCSGGGTLTTYIAALDARIKAAAPACYISSWEEQLLGTGPQDAEQQFPDQLAEGLNHADWIGLAAPMPYLIVSTDQDFFPLEGARRSFNEMKRIYTLYDAAVKIDWFHEPGGHGWPKASREAIYGWMNRWLRGDGSAVKEPTIEPEPEELLNATETGQVATSLKGETASTWNIKRFRDRRPASGIDLKEEVARLTRYQASTAPLAIERTTDGRIRFQADTGLTFQATLRSPAGGHQGKTALLLTSKGKPDEAIDRLTAAGNTVLALDLSTGPGARLPWMALMVGRPLVGIHMNTIRRALDALAELKLLPADGIPAYSQGNIGAALLHAALLDKRIQSVNLNECVLSYHNIASTPINRDVDAMVIPGVLGRYDLPQLVQAIAPRLVTLRNMTAANGRILLRREVSAAYPGIALN